MLKGLRKLFGGAVPPTPSPPDTSAVDMAILAKVSQYPVADWTFREVSDTCPRAMSRTTERTYTTTTPSGATVVVRGNFNFSNQGDSQTYRFWVDNEVPAGMGNGLPKQIYDELVRRTEQAHLDRLRNDPEYRETHEKAEREADEQRRRAAIRPLDKL